MFNFIKLSFNCKNCKEINFLKENAYARADLENQLGTNFHKKCTKCLTHNNYHVNDVVASGSESMFLLFVLAAILLIGVLTLFLLQMGFISILTIALPVVVYVIYYKQTDATIQTFNKHLVSRNNNYVPKKKI